MLNSTLGCVSELFLSAVGRNDCFPDLCRLPRARFSNEDKRLMACDDVTEALLVFPDGKLQPFLQDLVVSWCVWQVGEGVHLLVHSHLLESRHDWYDRCAVGWDARRLCVSVSVPVSVPVPVSVSVSISVPVSGAVLAVSVPVSVSFTPKKTKTGNLHDHIKDKLNMTKE